MVHMGWVLSLPVMDLKELSSGAVKVLLHNFGPVSV